MIARVLLVVAGVAGCSRGATDEQRPPAPEAKDRSTPRPTATLELKIVDAGDDLSKTVYARAFEDLRKDNPDASDDDILYECLTTRAGVGANTDYWNHEPVSSKESRDWYLRSKHRAPLEAFLAAFPPPPDHEWGYELNQERCGRDRKPRPMWRSYYLFRAAELTGASVTGAKVKASEVTGRPEVVVTFDAEATRRFADLTEKNAGNKMAILVDGRVMSVPVIMERIPGGKMWITLQDSEVPQQLEKEARALADGLAPP